MKDEIKYKKVFELQEFRNNIRLGSIDVWCGSLMYEPTKIEECNDYLLVNVMVAKNETNIRVWKYDKDGTFWRDGSRDCGLDLFTKVINTLGEDITEKYLRDVRGINFKRR